MGKLYSLVSALLLAVGAAYAADPSDYEWWFDNDMSTYETGSLSGNMVDFQIDISELPKGIHYFNLRLSSAEGVGTVYRKMFHSFGQDDGAISYEYWFNSDYASKVTGDIAVGNNAFLLDISNLPAGVHYFNCRFGHSDGEWGSIYRKMILNLDGNVNAVAYEYWIDNNYEGKTEGSISYGENSYVVDIDGIRKGLHRFNYRIQSGSGEWGSIFTKYFYTVSNELGAIEYEYWLDNDFENRVSESIKSHPITFDVDLGSYDKSGGAHFFNYRARDDNGDWGSIYRKLIIFNNGGGHQPIIGYRHYLDGDSLGYVAVDRQLVDSYMFEVNLPDSVYPSMKNRRPTFDGDRVFIAGADSIDYAMQIRTELGWAPPQMWKLGISNNFSTTAVAMQVNTRHTFKAPSGLEFAAMKFTSTGDTLYVRSDIPVALDIYRNGEKVKTLSPSQVKGMSLLTLEAGEYFGVLYSVDDAKAKDLTLHLMDTPNRVPIPEIEYNEGFVSISCSRADAVIRYSLDGTIPTEESVLYTEPFKADHNMTVKALAYIPDSDIEPSDVAKYEIDIFKVEVPTSEFDPVTRLLTLTCETKNATIKYSDDFDLKDTESATWLDYMEPIRIRKNRSLFVQGFRDGYNESEIAEIKINSLPDSVPTPKIEFANGTVTITCAEKDADIHFTLDGNVPTAESALYEGPFQLRNNATVMAFAFISDLDIEPSEVAVKVVDSFKLNAPTGVFDVKTRTLTLSSDNADAKIYYTFDRAGEWILYSQPIVLRKNCIVYAKASLDGFNDSDVAEIAVSTLTDSVPVPEISFAGGTVEITCANPEAQIRYALDGDALNMESTLYEGAFRLDRNATIRAFAYIPDLDIEPSDITTYVVDSYKVSTPYGEFDSLSRLLTIICDTEESSIFYSFDRHGEWMPYGTTVRIDGNGTVYAKATRDGYKDSEIGEITVSDVKCAPVSISYNGHYVKIDATEPGASIRYSTDGSEPSDGIGYVGEFDAEGLCTIRAVAIKPDHMNSDVAELQIECYADEEHAETSAGGLLESCFDWSEPGLKDRMESFSVEGVLNDTDYAFIRSMSSLRHLDIEKVREARIPDNAFTSLRLISISLPSDLAGYGDNILSGADNLSSVIWNSRTLNPDSRLTDGLANPNVLIYVPDGINIGGSSDLNVITPGKETSVALRYGFPYYAARGFRADRISLTHEFTQTTKPDICRGWETIVLPFEPTVITHEINGPIVPFAAWNGDVSGDKPFWLYRAASDGWEADYSIQACVPYIISMPNNPDYVESFNLGGKVTFSATDVDLGPDSSFPYADIWKGGTQFEGTFLRVEEKDLLSLNVNAPEDPDMQPGSAFVADAVTLPFGAYVRGASGRKAMPLFGDSSDVDTPLLIDAGLLIESPAPGVLKISSGRERRVAVTTMTGVTLCTLHLRPGETGLTRDFYIVGGRKVKVR